MKMGLFVVGLLINWIGFAVIGGVIVDALGWLTNLSTGQGVFIGLLVGTWINIVLGGFMVALDGMNETIEVLRARLLNKLNNLENSFAALRDNLETAYSVNNASAGSLVNQSPVASNAGEIWHCKKCGTVSALTATACKDCGTYK